MIVGPTAGGGPTWPPVCGPFAMLIGTLVKVGVGCCGKWFTPGAPPTAVTPDSEAGLFAGLTSGFQPPGGGDT